MKKTAAVILTVLTLMFCGSPVLALEFKEYSVSFHTPDGYTGIDAENAAKYESAIKLLGHSVSSFKNYLKANNVLVFAVWKDNSRQIRLSWDKTEFSQDLYDMSLLKTEALDRLGKQIIGDDSQATWNLVSIDDIVYFEIINNANDEESSTSVQYFTIKNGTIYTLILYGDNTVADEAFINEAAQVAGALKISHKKTGITASDADTVLEIVLIFLLLAAALVVAVLIIISFFRDARRRRDSDQNGGEMTIHRRKY